MTTAHITQQTREASHRDHAAFVGFYYLLSIFLGAFVLLFRGQFAFTADLIASVFYLAATALFYEWSKQVRKTKARH